MKATSRFYSNPLAHAKTAWAHIATPPAKNDPDSVTAITTCSIDIIQDKAGRFYVCEFNLGLQSGGQSDGEAKLWRQIIQENYQERFPQALIDDYEKTRYDKSYSKPIEHAQNKLSDKGEVGLVIFRYLLDAKKEFELRYRYRRYNPIIADPLPLRAIYMNKAYAAALDEDGLFPKSIILTGKEIHSGALLKYFSPDEKIIIKCPRNEGAQGTVIARAGDKGIPLSEDEVGPLFVVQPVIPTKGITFHTDTMERHHNTSFRVYLTIALLGKNSVACTLWRRQFLCVAQFPSSSERPEAIINNRPITDGTIDLPDSTWITPPESEVINNEALTDFCSERIIPFIANIMRKPFDTTVMKKLLRAKQNKDALRIRALAYLLADHKWYFSFSETPFKEDRRRNQFSKAAVVATEPFISLKRRSSKAFISLTSVILGENPRDVNNKYVKGSDWFIRKSLGL